MINIEAIDLVGAYGAFLATITAVLQIRQHTKSKSDLNITACYLSSCATGADQAEAYISASVVNRADREACIGSCVIVWVRRPALASVQFFILHHLPLFCWLLSVLAINRVLEYFQERRFSPVPKTPPEVLPPGKTWSWTCDVSELAFAAPSGGVFFIMMRDAYRKTPYLHRVA